MYTDLLHCAIMINMAKPGLRTGAGDCVLCIHAFIIIILYMSTTWERPSRWDGPRRRSSATVLSKAYAVGDIARRIPLRSNAPLLV